MATALSDLVERGFLIRSLRGFHRRRLTPRGRFVFWAAAGLALLGMDTRRALVFIPFCLAAPPLLLALPQLFRRSPRARLADRLPTRLTAGRRVSVPIEVAPEHGAAPGLVSLMWDGPLPEGLSADPLHRMLEMRDGRPQRVVVSFLAQARGRYELPALLLAHTDGFGLLRSKSRWLTRRVVLAYPRYYTIDRLDLPLGRRYQPGGIPFASTLGDSVEFVGTREYREGDPPRRIHWRSWARLGRPVVKEYQEEYFSRIALVLDTFLPPRAGAGERRRLEAAISALTSIAEHFSRSEEVVDILAAGPDLYEVSAGRSLGYLGNVLDVLACLEPCAGPPFETVQSALFEKLEGLTAVVVVLLDWDERREAFLRKMSRLGVAVRVLLVHEGETRRPWPSGASEIGEVTLLPPRDIEARLAAESER